MRRLIFVQAMVVSVVVVAGPVATAQETPRSATFRFFAPEQTPTPPTKQVPTSRQPRVQPRPPHDPNPSPPPSDDHASSGPSGDDDREGERGGRDRDGDRDDRWRHRHGRHRHGDRPIFLWPPIILPWPGDVAYIPGYTPYYRDPALGGWSPLAPVAAPDPVVNAPAPADPPAADAAKSKIRTTNAATKARAGKFIGYGDANFNKQNYLSAAERYKDAARIAPDVADAYLRQGFAFIAMGNYDSAARAIRRGLGIRTDWRGSPFRLDQLYVDDQISKTSHVENLAKAAEANPLDADLMMLLGMMMYFDGQVERSETFFAGAAQAGGNEEHLLDHFLRQPRPAGAPPQNDPPPAGGKLVF